MCNYCNIPIYIKSVQYVRPCLRPLTEEQELRDRLLDLTGEVYIEMPKRFCPMCGREVKENALDQACKDFNRKVETAVEQGCNELANNLKIVKAKRVTLTPKRSQKIKNKKRKKAKK